MLECIDAGTLGEADKRETRLSVGADLPNQDCCHDNLGRADLVGARAAADTDLVE